MNVSLTPQLEKWIQKKVSSGRYHSASEVVREALRLLEDQETMLSLKRKKLTQEIKLGLVQANRGELIPAKKVFRKLRRGSKAAR